MKKSITPSHFFPGGLAELLQSPSPLTLALFQYWFTGTGSLGEAMRILKLPATPINTPIIELFEGDAAINLVTEEKILYSKTLFQYSYNRSYYDAPRVVFNPRALISPQSIVNTLRMMFVQSALITNAPATKKKCEAFLESIPPAYKATTAREEIELMKTYVWPYVYAIGYCVELYSKYFEQTHRVEYKRIMRRYAKTLSLKDWHVQSDISRTSFLSGALPYESFIGEYGVRADNDFEISSPRWHEKAKKDWHIKRTHGTQEKETPPNKNISDTIQNFADILAIRSLAKKKSLEHYDHLRQLIIAENKGKDIQTLSLEKILGKKIPFDDFSPSSPPNQTREPRKMQSTVPVGVSPGTVSGIAQKIETSDAIIKKNTIGIFPNSGTAFTFLYPKCAGIIFLTGGAMTHGAIVAREYGIPAIVNAAGQHIPKGTNVTIVGDTGELIVP